MRTAHTLRRIIGIVLITFMVAASIAQAAPLIPTRTPTPTPEAEATSPGESTSLDLTIYNQNLGLVREVRQVDLLKGLNTIRFTDVASQIRPTTVHVVSLTAPTKTVLLEQNYEYDIVSTQKILQKYVDQPIQLTTREGQVYTGTLLSGDADVILATDEGITIVRLEQIQEFSFPTLPEGLITKPTLVWLLEAAEAGPQDLEVTYLTSGLNWQADYIATLNAEDDKVTLTGWVSVDNNSGATYRNARLKLVAGTISQVTPEVPSLEKEGVRMAIPAPQVEERAFFEYHLYEIKRPVTLRDRQTKQIEFVQASNVPVEKEYIFEFTPPIFVALGHAITDPGYSTQEPTHADVRLHLVNDEKSGLGIPLPAGIVRVYKEDIDGGAQFVGEDRIDHTPRNESISLVLGQAFDIVGERRQVAFRQLGERQLEETIEIALRNQKEEPVTVSVIEHLYRAHDAEILESDRPYEKVDANTIRYEVTINPEEEETLTYTVIYRW